MNINTSLRFPPRTHHVGFLLQGQFLMAGWNSDCAEEGECKRIRASILSKELKLIVETNCKTVADYMQNKKSNISWMGSLLSLFLSQILDLFHIFFSSPFFIFKHNFEGGVVLIRSSS
ncbi:hypothetical protein FRX31_031692 [Thalictrum thalictroides]|uniref:RNase H type-1 domain-containing protein n=1 Tax=Thalictrum thalictroides TaxID=46969 RepID=A0A7J6V2T3_THATH|nr:hypothetical protein FRX31_031692 [Thalictrum thalictroides]